MRSARKQQRWAAARMFAMVVASIGLTSIVPTAIHGQGAPKAAVAPAPAKTAGSLILGAIESIAVADMNDPSSPGRMVVRGKEITIPSDVLIGLPTGHVSLRDLVLEAPEECKSQQPPQSGLAQSDTCLNGGSPALARVIATRSASGDMVASTVMVQKDSARTLARMKADSPRAARAKARASLRQ